MRHYPLDSHLSSARIVGLALLADGAIDPSELALLRHRDTLRHLGLDEAGLDRVIHDLCEDLLLYAHRTPAGELEIGSEALRGMLDEIDDPRLRRRLLRTILDIVHADGELAPGEASLVAHATRSWTAAPREVTAPRGLAAAYVGAVGCPA